MGGGSTDAAVISETGEVTMTHQAGAGELVSMLIETELGLGDRHMAEQIKNIRSPKWKVCFHMRMENGQMTFVEDSIDPRFYGRVVLLAEDGLIRIEQDIPMEKIAAVRREAKRKVFVTNAFRALKKVAPGHDLRKISNVVLVGGSAEDFEIPEMLMEEIRRVTVLYAAGEISGVRKAPQCRSHRACTFICRRTKMIIKKPSIFIYVNNPDTSSLRNVCAGIEEEGYFRDKRNGNHFT